MYPSRLTPTAHTLETQLDIIGYSKKDLELRDLTQDDDDDDGDVNSNDKSGEIFDKGDAIEGPKKHFTEVTKVGKSRQGTSSGFHINDHSLEDLSSTEDYHPIHSVSSSELDNTRRGRTTDMENGTDDNINETSNEVDEEDEEILYPDGGLKAWSVVLGSFLGSIIVFGIMNTIGPIETELETNILKDSSVSSVSWVFSIYMFFSLFGGLIVGPAFDTIGGKPLLIGGMLVQFAGMFACGSCTELWQFILSFGVVVGIGTALALTPVIACVSHYFKKKRGFAIGIAQSGGNIGGIIFPIMLRSLYPNLGFVWSMRIFAFIVLFLSGCSVILCTDRLDELNKKKRITTSVNLPKWRIILKKIISSVDLKSFKDKSFLLLVSGLFLNEFSLLLALTYLSSYAVVRGWSISTSYVMITVLNACGTVGKWVAAKSADMFGPFNVMLCLSLMMSILIFVIWGPLGGTSALWVFVTIFGFCCSATYSLSGACVAHISRTNDFGRRYGTAYFFVSFGNLISLPLGGALIKQGSVKDYNNMVWFAGATCVLGTILFFISRVTIGGYSFRAYV